jgi:hypothetical protein
MVSGRTSWPFLPNPREALELGDEVVQLSISAAETALG